MIPVSTAALAICLSTAPAPQAAKAGSTDSTKTTGAKGADSPDALAEATRMVEQLRYEEAVVEYQRYLSDKSRPSFERARALFDLAFVHMVLGDDVTAEARALEAFSLHPKLTLPSSAPPRQLSFFTAVREMFVSRPQLELLSRQAADTVNTVRVGVSDPKQKIRRLLLRHGSKPGGPFASTALDCEARSTCSGAIPQPRENGEATSYYFVEALDENQQTLAQLSSESEPLQLVLVEPKSWYKSPVTWGIAGAVLVGAATLVYFLVPPPAPGL
jgi:hypothetical protein